MSGSKSRSSYGTSNQLHIQLPSSSDNSNVLVMQQVIQTRIRGKIRGFDEFMNVVIDDAFEIAVDPKSGKESDDKAVFLGRIMLKR